MQRFWPSAALLSLMLVVGCADRGEKNTESVAEPGAPAESPRSGDADANARPTGGGEAPRTVPAEAPPRPTAREETPRGAERSEAAPPRREARWRELVVPAGTTLPLELETAVSSETAQVETPVRARLKQAVVVNGLTALPIGAIVSGEVTAVERAGRVKGRSRLELRFNQIRADNLQTDLRTNPLTYVGEATKGEDATKIGAGAVGGAIVGGIVGGGDGAAKGAAIGGAAGTGVVLATRGREVSLASGANLAPSLAAPLTIRVPVR